ncbi:MAG: DNA polymerase III subunit delta [Deltaproteobacteria bacterium]|nr:DNA polymerase III subunit delta [Deltaproteobacteria bacterium]
MTATTPAWLRPLKPVYYVVGGDVVLLREAEAEIKAAVLREAVDFNFDRLAAKGLLPEALRSTTGQLPVFAERRLVVLVDFDEGGADVRRAVAAYVEAPVATTVLAVFAKKGEPGNFAKKIEKVGSVIRLAPPSARELPGWVRARAKAHGVELAPAAAGLLAELVGADVGRLDRVIEQATLFAGSPTVTEEHVAELVVATRSRSVFELVDALGSGKRETAALLLAKLFAQREAPPMILAMLARHVRQLLVANDALCARARPGEIASRLGLPPFIADKITDQARRLDERALTTMLDELFHADLAIKSSPVDPEVILERTVLSLSNRLRPR